MNQRIKDIFDQACFETDYDDVQNLRETMDRFAELIVRECMDLLEDYTTDIHVGGIQYNVVGASETLQEYFGLED